MALLCVVSCLSSPSLLNLLCYLVRSPICNPNQDCLEFSEDEKHDGFKIDMSDGRVTLNASPEPIKDLSRGQTPDAFAKPETLTSLLSFEYRAGTASASPSHSDMQAR
jgi:hypothetical protein